MGLRLQRDLVIPRCVSLGHQRGLAALMLGICHNAGFVKRGLYSFKTRPVLTFRRVAKLLRLNSEAGAGNCQDARGEVSLRGHC